jgi:hypothetical protein
VNCAANDQEAMAIVRARFGNVSEVNLHMTVLADRFLTFIEDSGIGLSSEFITGLRPRVIDSRAPLSCELSNGTTQGCVSKVVCHLGDS